MSDKTDRTVQAILRILRNAQTPLGSMRIGRKLQALGIDLSERSIRLYLQELDARGLTRLVSPREGRVLSPKGEEEAEAAGVIGRLDFTSARIDMLSCSMSFDPRTAHGTVMLNLSIFKRDDFEQLRGDIRKAFAQGWGMGRLLLLKQPGEQIAGLTVHDGEVVLGTLCSFTVNGILLRAGIPVRARYGGLLEVREHHPHRFTTLINYEGSTIDPLETFMRAGMTSVRRVCERRRGIIGASFREVPGIARDKIQKVLDRTQQLGLAGMIELGRPNQDLLGVPVGSDRAGLVVAGGMNPVAVGYEAGIPIRTIAMACLTEYRELQDFEEVL